MRLSPIRGSRIRMSHSWLTVSKELIKDYPSPRLLWFGEDFASTPSFGGTRSRSHGGIATGRRSTLARRASRRQPHPRSGTMDELEAQRNRLQLASGDEGREPCIAALADLLHLRTIVDALLDRESTSRPEPVIDEEGNHATKSGVSRTRPFSAVPAASIQLSHGRRSFRRLLNDNHLGTALNRARCRCGCRPHHHVAGGLAVQWHQP